MLLLRDDRVNERRRAVGGPLAPLFESLAAELAPLLGRDPHIPDAKALLSRAGGRCERDGAVLDFDPWSPHAHRCPVCDTLHTGDLHHRAWITSYQLWLAERGVHAALFHLLRPDARHAAVARDILCAYAERYDSYPNRDNVLGPTRLFFSTYLESIWLLQICIAADLLEQSGDRATPAIVRDRIVGPSSALIADYDEGMSNRQVWNNAALLAAAALTDDDRAFDMIVHRGSGLRAHLDRALLPDGTWYEGENYHLFALRGLWYGAVMAEARGRVLEGELLERFHRAFAAPFVTALPDFTLPSRKDSPYAVSLRQWRIAELTELGFARHQAPLLGAALARCYERGHERRDTGRARSTADVERNGPASSLTRADLGWRALLHALPELPPLAMQAPRSALLEGQGLAVFRRDDDVYVCCDYGQSGGGHGHPDRLNILLSQGATRWLDDLGTGSYVDPSLHWYRSTLAHNAPLVGGRSQPMLAGALRAYDEREGIGWIVAELVFPDDDVRLERTVVVAPDYVIDELSWRATRDVRVELPMHLDAVAPSVTMNARALDGGEGLEDGFAFVSDSRAVSVAAGQSVALQAQRDGRTLRALVLVDRDYTLFSTSGPGQPASIARRFHVVRARSREGSIRSALVWRPDVSRTQVDSDVVTIEYASGERHTHRRDSAGWHVELVVGAARSGVDLAGWRAATRTEPAPLTAARSPTILRRSRTTPGEWLSELSPGERGLLATYQLEESHYRRTEETWTVAGSPRALIALSATDEQLVLLALVTAGDRAFAKAEADNPFDNESADTMAAGLQLYVRTAEDSGAWMLVPDSDGGSVRVRRIRDWGGGGSTPPRARWRESGQGYEMRIELPLPAAAVMDEYPLDVDVIVNETAAGRERRRGQLIMSGARGEFAYLRGDRHDPARLIPLVLVR